MYFLHRAALLAAVMGCAWVAPTQAQPMHFEAIGNGGNCVGCAYTQASGEITIETAKVFDTFARSQEFGVGPVRLNSPGGSLLGGIMLGELFRSKGVSTEVGSSAPIPGTTGFADRAPGVCASACAYAFLGGKERSLDDDAKLGYHRFYQENALAEPATKLFTGKDLGDAQITTASLVLYILRMGVDASLISLASEAGPNEMRWISRDEASKLRITYEPWAYKPWRVEPYRGGAVAIAESNDGLKSIVVSCSKQLGPNVTIIHSKADSDLASAVPHSAVWGASSFWNARKCKSSACDPAEGWCSVDAFSAANLRSASDFNRITGV
jgi:hypothetical protein